MSIFTIDGVDCLAMGAPFSKECSFRVTGVHAVISLTKVTVLCTRLVRYYRVQTEGRLRTIRGMLRGRCTRCIRSGRDVRLVGCGCRSLGRRVTMLEDRRSPRGERTFLSRVRTRVHRCRTRGGAKGGILSAILADGDLCYGGGKVALAYITSKALLSFVSIVSVYDVFNGTLSGTVRYRVGVRSGRGELVRIAISERGTFLVLGFRGCYRRGLRCRSKGVTAAGGSGGCRKCKVGDVHCAIGGCNKTIAVSAGRG